MPQRAALSRLPSGRRPVRTRFVGRFVALEPLEPRAHLDDLFTAAAPEEIWTWLGYGPFETKEAMGRFLEDCAGAADPLFFTVRDGRDGRAKGMCAWLRIEPGAGVVEIGHIWYGLELQRTPATTEAMYLLFRHVMDELGYRRLEWKCNALNEKSRKAALRLGFTFEGIFRQHMISKGRNRDTAWFSLLDHEWPAVRDAFEGWLAPGNFSASGQQHVPLGELIAAARQGA